MDRLQAKSPKYECLLFDFDDTLYPFSADIASASGKNIRDYMVQKLGIEESKITALGNLMYMNYGTTMAGLRAIGYDFDYDEYLAGFGAVGVFSTEQKKKLLWGEHEDIRGLSLKLQKPEIGREAK